MQCCGTEFKFILQIGSSGDRAPLLPGRSRLSLEEQRQRKADCRKSSREYVREAHGRSCCSCGNRVLSQQGAVFRGHDRDEERGAESGADHHERVHNGGAVGVEPFFQLVQRIRLAGGQHALNAADKDAVANHCRDGAGGDADARNKQVRRRHDRETERHQRPGTEFIVDAAEERGQNGAQNAAGQHRQTGFEG